MFLLLSILCLVLNKFSDFQNVCVCVCVTKLDLWASIRPLFRFSDMDECRNVPSRCPKSGSMLSQISWVYVLPTIYYLVDVDKLRADLSNCLYFIQLERRRQEYMVHLALVSNNVDEPFYDIFIA